MTSLLRFLSSSEIPSHAPTATELPLFVRVDRHGRPDYATVVNARHAVRLMEMGYRPVDESAVPHA